MAKKIDKSVMCIWNGYHLVPATEFDREKIKLEKNQAVNVTFTVKNHRHIAHHRKLFAGLIPLIMHYWQPTGGLFRECELQVLNSYNKYLADITGQQKILNDAMDDFISKETESRKSLVGQLDGITKDAVLDDIKMGIKHYEIQQAVKGITFKPKSINFASMGQDEFEAFYNSAKNYAWNAILSRAFKSQKDMDNAVMQLLSL